MQMPSLQPLCDNCFSEQIEHRIRKNARINKLFKKGDKLITIGPLADYLTRRIIEGLPLTITSRKTPPKTIPRGAKLVLPDTMDDIEYDFLTAFFAGKPIENDDAIRIMRVITDQEALRLAACASVRFQPKPKDNMITGFLHTLEEKHAETRFSLLKSIDDIKKRLR